MPLWLSASLSGSEALTCSSVQNGTFISIPPILSLPIFSCTFLFQTKKTALGAVFYFTGTSR
ncbi:hypothetical protein C1T28_15285 [Bacillus subtilis]|nr:hypothetical protein C1T25_19960 [Bacillus cereus]POO73423.1 hypothetical protein C1T28_15285 [Bacillus subtilis]